MMKILRAGREDEISIQLSSVAFRVGSQETIDRQHLNTEIDLAWTNRAGHNFLLTRMDKKYFQNNIKCDYSYLEPVGEYPKLFNSKQIFNDFQTASELKSFIVLHHNFDVVTFVREWRIPTDECNGIHQNKKQISVAIHCFSFTRGKYYSISFVYLLKLIHLHAVWIPLVPIILNELAFAFSSFSNREALFMIRRGTEFSVPDAKLWK